MACAAIHATAFPPSEAWTAPDLTTLLGMPGVYGLIRDTGREAGLVLVRCAADEAEILTLAIAPNARRRGLGRQLLIAALDRAKTAGATRVFLEVSEANTAARALYASAGFVPCGRRTHYYPDGSDALVLQVTVGG